MARISPLVLLPPLLFASLAVLFATGMFRDDPNALPSARAGEIAPEVALAPLGEGPPFTAADLADGEVKLVNYWASWCAPCRAEHPILEALADEGIPIYGINYKDDPEKALAFLDELGNPFTAIGADRAGRVAIDWGVYGVPETYLVDGDGRIVLRFAGPLTAASLERTLRPALAEAAGATGGS